MALCDISCEWTKKWSSYQTTGLSQLGHHDTSSWYASIQSDRIWPFQLTFSLPRVHDQCKISPCSLTRNITSHSMDNLALQSLLYSDERWSTVPILTTFSIYGWENVPFDLGSGRVIQILQIRKSTGKAAKSGPRYIKVGTHEGACCRDMSRGPKSHHVNTRFSWKILLRGRNFVPATCPLNSNQFELRGWRQNNVTPRLNTRSPRVNCSCDMSPRYFGN